MSSQKGQGIAGIQVGKKRQRRARHGRDSGAETMALKWLDRWVRAVSRREKKGRAGWAGAGLRARGRAGMVLGRWAGSG